MVMSVIPIVCEISAGWLGRGRSSTNDWAGLTPDMAAIDRQSKSPRRTGLNMVKASIRFVFIEKFVEVHSPFKMVRIRVMSVQTFHSMIIVLFDCGRNHIY